MGDEVIPANRRRVSIEASRRQARLTSIEVEKDGTISSRRARVIEAISPVRSSAGLHKGEVPRQGLHHARPRRPSSAPCAWSVRATSPPRPHDEHRAQCTASGATSTSSRNGTNATGRMPRTSRPTSLRVIERHIAEYSPFDVYAKVLSMSTSKDTKQTDRRVGAVGSRVYRPNSIQYQRRATRPCSRLAPPTAARSCAMASASARPSSG